MNNSTSSTRLVLAVVALIAALILVVSFFLPWVSWRGAAAASLIDTLTRAHLSAMGWLTILLVCGGALAAAVMAIATLVVPAGKTDGILAGLTIGAFAAAILGFIVFMLDWTQNAGQLSSSGYSIGFGVWLGILVTVAGLILGGVELVGVMGAQPGHEPEVQSKWLEPSTYGQAPVQASPSEAGGFGDAASSARSARQSVAQPASSIAYPRPTPYPRQAIADQTTAAQVPSAAAPEAASVAEAAPVPAPLPEPASPQPARSARLTYVEAGHPTSIVVNPGQKLVVGRDAAAEIRISDPYVSRRHIVIERLDDGWAIRDQGATNPAHLLSASGSAPIVGSTRLTSGQIMIGAVVITLFDK